jgi:hypothetical protein
LLELSFGDWKLIVLLKKLVFYFKSFDKNVHTVDDLRSKLEEFDVLAKRGFREYFSILNSWSCSKEEAKLF